MRPFGTEADAACRTGRIDRRGPGFPEHRLPHPDLLRASRGNRRRTYERRRPELPHRLRRTGTSRSRRGPVLPHLHPRQLCGQPLHRPGETAVELWADRRGHGGRSDRGGPRRRASAPRYLRAGFPGSGEAVAVASLPPVAAAARSPPPRRHAPGHHLVLGHGDPGAAAAGVSRQWQRRGGGLVRGCVPGRGRGLPGSSRLVEGPLWTHPAAAGLGCRHRRLRALPGSLVRLPDRAVPVRYGVGGDRVGGLGAGPGVDRRSGPGGAEEPARRTRPPRLERGDGARRPGGGPAGGDRCRASVFHRGGVLPGRDRVPLYGLCRRLDRKLHPAAA